MNNINKAFDYLFHKGIQRGTSKKNNPDYIKVIENGRTIYRKKGEYEVKRKGHHEVIKQKEVEHKVGATVKFKNKKGEYVHGTVKRYAGSHGDKGKVVHVEAEDGKTYGRYLHNVEAHTKDVTDSMNDLHDKKLENKKEAVKDMHGSSVISAAKKLLTHIKEKYKGDTSPKGLMMETQAELLEEMLGKPEPDEVGLESKINSITDFDKKELGKKEDKKEPVKPKKPSNKKKIDAALNELGKDIKLNRPGTKTRQPDIKPFNTSGSKKSKEAPNNPDEVPAVKGKRTPKEEDHSATINRFSNRFDYIIQQYPEGKNRAYHLGDLYDEILKTPYGNTKEGKTNLKLLDDYAATNQGGIRHKLANNLKFASKGVAPIQKEEPKNEEPNFTLSEGTEVHTDNLNVGSIKKVVTYTDAKGKQFHLSHLIDGKFKVEFYKPSKADFGKPINFTKKFETKSEVEDYYEYIMNANKNKSK